MKREYLVGNYGNIKLHIDSIAEQYEPEDLFTMALRHNNPRRSFLFVSKILGKHIPIKASDLQRATNILAEEWCKLCCDNSDKPVLVIGFAETATAMGHCFFSKLSGDVSYIHSTRENPNGVKSILYAEESHSHAVDHNFFLNDMSVIEDAENIVIVDDEITTGKTALNLINAIDSKFPGKKFSVATFLDWRNSKDREIYNRGINNKEIKTVSLLEGEIEENTLTSPTSNNDANWQSDIKDEINWNTTNLNFEQSNFSENDKKFIKRSGRFGISLDEQEKLNREIDAAGKELNKIKCGKNILVLGQGECMYIPMRLSEEIGGDVSFHATTRSPAWPTDKFTPYGIESGFTFGAIDGSNYNEFIYNILDKNYDELFLITEYSCNMNRINEFMKFAHSSGIKNLNHVVLGK